MATGKTTLNRVSILESIVSAFVTSNVSRYGRLKMIELLDQGRAVGIEKAVMGGQRLHPSWQQPLVIPYQESTQDDNCFAVYNIPSVITVRKLMDGYVFIGSEDFSISYKRFNTRGEFNNAKKHPMLSRAWKNGVAALVEDSQVKLYSEQTQGKIQSLGVIGIWNAPTKLPYFNIAVDEYPIDETTFDYVKNWIKETVLNQVSQEVNTHQTTEHNQNVSQPQSRRR